MFNCFYCGLLIEHFMMRAVALHHPYMIILMVIPPILGIFVLSPLIIKQFALWGAVAALEEVTLSKTIAYMKEEEALCEKVSKSLRDALEYSNKIVRGHKPKWEVLLTKLFDRFDVDNSGTLSPKEIRDGLAAAPMHLYFTDQEFHELMRVADPDQGGSVDL